MSVTEDQLVSAKSAWPAMLNSRPKLVPTAGYTVEVSTDVQAKLSTLPISQPLVSEAETINIATLRIGSILKSFGALVSDQCELTEYLSKVTESRIVAASWTELAIKLSNPEKSVRAICDNLTRIIASTEAIMKYCGNHNVIPYIITLIREKRYLEADKEIKGFLRCLKNLIKRFKEDTEEVHTSLNKSEMLPSFSADSASDENIRFADLSSELGKITKSNIHSCLSRLFEHLDGLPSIINEETVDELKLDSCDVDGWTYKEKILQSLYENFSRLY